MTMLRRDIHGEKRDINILSSVVNGALGIVTQPVKPLEDIEAEDIVVYTISPIIPPLDERWVLLDTYHHPDAHEVMYEAGIVENDIVTMIAVGNNLHPCVRLTDDAYQYYLEQQDETEVEV